MNFLTSKFLKTRKGKVWLVVNLLLVWLLWGLVVNFSSVMPEQIPFFYSQPWGSSQLVSVSLLYLFPIIATSVLLLNLVFINVLWNNRELDLVLAVVLLATATQVAFLVSLARIVVNVASSYQITVGGRLFLAGSASFAVSYLLTPAVKIFANTLGAVDDPTQHRHPAILHKRSLPRAGSLAFLLAFIAISFLVVPVDTKLLGIWLGAILMAVIGVIDDRGASGKFREINPYVRLLSEILAALVVVSFGVSVPFFRNPLGGVVRLDALQVTVNFFGQHSIFILASLVAILWIVWVMNMLSWSNGVDGQFSGIVFLTCIFLSLISLRVANGDLMQVRTAVLFAVAGGAALGLLPVSWHPSKILWGFGATSCGLIIAALSILSTAKVATSVLVLLVPTLDAVVAIFRRVLKGTSPVWGDSAHFHHHLLKIGLSQKQVALFYWALTFICGLLALHTVQKGRFLTLLMAGGLVAFVLTVVNWGRSGFSKFLFWKDKQDNC
ncbi:MAG: MraY family glycosyltransferase [Patescibacteria group bacterium]|nr:MraY family glycosyltransferase [Patescibacteria group bacterium]